MTVQPNLCRTCSETTLLVFPQGGSFVYLSKIIFYFQILGDKVRLIKRTQLKRSQYKILGKKEDDNKTTKDATEESGEDNPVNQEHLKDYDTEIFDDSDFYHQLLRELIEKKTSDINDPVALSRLVA